MSKQKDLIQRIENGLVSVQGRIYDVSVAVSTLKKTCHEPLLNMIDEYLDTTHGWALDLGVPVADLEHEICEQERANNMAEEQSKGGKDNEYKSRN